MKNRVASMLVWVGVDGDGIARSSGCRVWVWMHVQKMILITTLTLRPALFWD